MLKLIKKRISKVLFVLTVGVIIFGYQNCDQNNNKSSSQKTQSSQNVSLEARIQELNNRINELSTNSDSMKETLDQTNASMDLLQRRADAADRRISKRVLIEDDDHELHVHRYGVSCEECTLSYGSPEAKKSACHGSHERPFSTVLRNVAAIDSLGIIYKTTGENTDSCTSLKNETLQLCRDNSSNPSSCEHAPKGDQKCLIVCAVSQS